MKPYYEDDVVTLYHGDCREVLPSLKADLIVTDPPYGETSLEWDCWPDGWLAVALSAAPQMWCFGSMRMFLTRVSSFVGWKFAQEVVWEKQNGSGPVTDRFRRVHEFATHWYRGPWGELPLTPQREQYSGPRRHATRPKGGVLAPHRDQVNTKSLEWHDDGTRLTPSVLRVPSMHRRAAHPSEKPPGILRPLIDYSSRPGQTVLDPFAGSGSTLLTARAEGRKAVGVEADERYCELIVRRLAQDVLDFGEAS